MIIKIRLFYGTLQQTIKLQYNLNRMKLHKILILMFKAPNSLSIILSIKNMNNWRTAHLRSQTLAIKEGKD